MAPLVVITGPTASGKSGLAMELAERFGGEIICADSRTVYKSMDIGTAKPSYDDQQHVPHHLLDVAESGDVFTAKDFQGLANKAITDIQSRGKIPFLVGGTGLYIDAVVLDYEWPETTGNRSAYETASVAELQAMLKEQRLAMPTNPSNKRHLINTLMRGGKTGLSRSLPLENTLVVAIATDKIQLEQRIRMRAKEMFDEGVIAETQTLASRFGWDSEAMSSNIYPIVRRVIDKEITEAEAIELFVIKDKQLAKRQITWLKRHNYVQWYELEAARGYIEQILTTTCANMVSSMSEGK